MAAHELAKALRFLRCGLVGVRQGGVSDRPSQIEDLLYRKARPLNGEGFTNKPNTFPRITRIDADRTCIIRSFA